MKITVEKNVQCPKCGSWMRASALLLHRTLRKH